MKKMLLLSILALSLMLLPSFASAEDFAGPPAFSIDLGEGFVKEELTSEGDVVRGKTPGDLSFNVTISDASDENTAEKGGEIMVGILKGLFSHLKDDDIEVVENEEYELDSGEMAWKAAVEWVWTDGSYPLTNYLMSVEKDGKIITANGTGHGGMDDEVIDIIETLELK